MKKILLVLLFISQLYSISYDDAINQTKNPRIDNSWISNDSKVLSEKNINAINAALEILNKNMGIEFAIIVKQNLDVKSTKDFAHRIFNRWKIGNKETNTGLLLVIIIDQRQWAFEVGYGLESVLPDSFTGDLGRNTMAPHFRNNKYYSGITDTIIEIAKRIDKTPKNMIGAKAPFQLNIGDTSFDLIHTSQMITLLLIFLAIVVFGIQQATKPNGLEKVKIMHLIFIALFVSTTGILFGFFQFGIELKLIYFFVELGGLYLIWKKWDSILLTPKSLRNFYILFFISIAVTAFSPVKQFIENPKDYFITIPVIVLIAIIFPLHFLVRKAIRRGKHICHSCQGEMELQSEKTEDTWLEKKQISEEKIKSIDYDVWICKKCENIRIEPYFDAGQYEKCPSCTAIAYRFIEKYVVTPATYSSSGSGVKVFQCFHCNKKDKKSYTIPRKTQSSSSSGGYSSSSSSGGYSSSSSSSGGSFGGGSSGGGGASGGW